MHHSSGISGPGVERCAAAGATGTLRLVAIIGASALIVWALSDVALLIFMAVLLAVMLRGVSDWAARHSGVPASLMLALVSIAVAGCVAGFLYYFGPRLVSQSQDLWHQLSQELDHLRAAYGDTQWGKALFSNISPHALVQSHIAVYAGSVATTTLGGVVTGFILIVTALYFAIAPDLYVSGTVRLFPLPYRPRARAVLLDTASILRRWSLGQLIDMGVVGVLTGVGLALLGVPLALSLGVLAGLFTFVPYFGAIAAAVPAMVVALTVSWQTSLWVAVLFLACHAIEGYLVGPLVQRNTAELPPALTILSMTMLGGLFGPLGVILGAPVAAVVLVVVREAYVGDVLGEKDQTDVEMAG